jgi:uncharacterized protein (DUF2141 family)
MHMHKILTLALSFAIATSLPLSVSAASSSSDAEAAITSTLVTKDTTPRIAGTASDTKTVRIEVRNDDDKKVFSKKSIRVKKDRWSTTVSKKLKEGEYTVSVYERNSGGKPLTTETLVIGKNAVAKGSALSVSQLPLLMGGVATPGLPSAVAYVMFKNTGSTTATISGITLNEVGSAPDSAVVGFTTNDDKGGSRATSTVQFKNGIATVPLAAEIAVGQTRIFTIKALISPNKILYGNKELKINVAGIESTSKIMGAFPLIGTTWILR